MKVTITKTVEVKVVQSYQSYLFSTSLSGELDIVEDDPSIAERSSEVIDDAKLFVPESIQQKIRRASMEIQALCVAEVEDDIRDYAAKDTKFRALLEMSRTEVEKQFRLHTSRFAKG